MNDKNPPHHQVRDAIGRFLPIELHEKNILSGWYSMVAWRVFQAPPDARFSDDHGIQLFLPASQTIPNRL